MPYTIDMRRTAVKYTVDINVDYLMPMKKSLFISIILHRQNIEQQK